MATSSFRVSSQILAVASSLALVSIVEIAPLTGVKSALLFSLLLLSIAVGAYRARHLLRAAPAKWLIPITVAASVIACLAFAFLTEERSPLMTFAWALAPTLTGWSILFWLIHSSDEQASIATWEPPRWSLPALLVATAVVLAIVHQLAVGRWTIVSDEVFYVMQSAWIRQPGYSWHVDPEIAPFFLMRKTGLSPDGGIIGMYTPGWPALLALFNAIGLRWWSGVILGTGSVYLTYRIGEALHSRRVGILAALLLATNPIFQLVHPGYVSHPAMIFLLALATLMLIQAEKADGRGRIVRWLAAGFLLSLALITRTLTGGAFTLSFAMWMLLRGRMNFSLMMRCALAVGVGALPLVLWFLHYNEVTSGAAFKLSYQALHGSGFNLGFGSRGFLGYDAAMNRVRIPVDFTPVVAIRHLLDMVLGVNLNFVAYAFLAPLVVVFALYGHRPNGRVLAAFLLLPLLHFFYWATGLRFYSEFLPLLLVWVAAGIFAVAQKNRALAARLTIAILVSNFVLAFPTRATSVTLASGWVRSAYFQSDGRLATFRTLENMSQARGKLLVFVSERIPLMDIMFDHLYQYNEQGLDSRILVVRDLGPRNKSLMARFPDRVPLMLRDRGRDGEASIQELTPAIAENIGEPSDATRVGSAR